MPQGDLIGRDYSGNAALGFSTDANIPAIDPKPALTAINGTIRDIMLLDSERNMKLFNQKVADRDNLTNTILQNQVHTGEINEEDQKRFDEASSQVEKAYKDWGGDWNNKEGYRAYQKQVTNLQDVAAHAQTRWAMLQKLELEKSQEKLPWKQKKLQDFIDQQKGITPYNDKGEKYGFWHPIDPYQQTFSYDHGRMQNSLLGGGMVTEGAGGQPEFPAAAPTKDTRTTKTTNGKTTVSETQSSVSGGKQPAPAKGTSGAPVTNLDSSGMPPLFTPVKKHYDYDQMRRTAEQLQIENGEDAENQNQWLSNVENYDEKGKKDFVDNQNIKLSQYNVERGFKKGDKGFVDPIQLVKDPNDTNKTHIKESPASYAAKTVLAGINGNYVTSEYQFNPDALKIRQEQDKMYLGKGKLAVDWYKAITGRRSEQLREKLFKKADQQTQNVPQVWDNILPQLEVQNVTTDNSVYGETDPKKIDFTIPEGDEPTLTVGGINSKGQGIELHPIPSKDKDGKIISGAGHYGTDFFIPKGAVVGKDASGNDIVSKKEMNLSPETMYKLYKQSGFSGEFKDFIMDKFNNKSLDYKLKGLDEHGKPRTADRVSSFQSQTLLGNKATKKGQQNPFALTPQQLMGIVATPDQGESGSSETETDESSSSTNPENN